MKYYGVVYDVGLKFGADDPYSVEPFNPALVRHDIGVIAREMHASAIRIEGEEISRLMVASRIAHEHGLSIFFNPWKMNVPVESLPEYFATAAAAVEELRNEGADIVFVCGCEMTLFNHGIFPGETTTERTGWLSNLGQLPQDEAMVKIQDKSAYLNRELRKIVDIVRKSYGGPLTYSAGAWEQVDWSLFDITGVDYYRHAESAEEYVAGLERYRSEKPFVVMEVGCCAYVGAAEKGAGGFMLLEGRNPDGTGKFLDDIVPQRSEEEQANYVGELLQLLNDAGVDGVFIYVFSFPVYPGGEGARDFDMMSFSLVKTFPPEDPRSELMPPWEAKKAFHRVADFYKHI